MAKAQEIKFPPGNGGGGMGLGKGAAVNRPPWSPRSPWAVLCCDLDLGKKTLKLVPRRTSQTCLDTKG